mgnify:CR=1 FL=1
MYFDCIFYKLHKDGQTNVKCSMQPGLGFGDWLGFEVIEYERPNLRRDDFVTIRSNGIYSEPVVNNTYPFDATVIVNSISAKLSIYIQQRLGGNTGVGLSRTRTFFIRVRTRTPNFGTRTGDF